MKPKKSKAYRDSKNRIRKTMYGYRKYHNGFNIIDETIDSNIIIPRFNIKQKKITNKLFDLQK